MAKFWFNVDTRQVEDESDRSEGAYLLGPYDSREAAAGALESARERTEAWDAEDASWEHRGESKP